MRLPAWLLCAAVCAPALVGCAGGGNLPESVATTTAPLVGATPHAEQSPAPAGAVSVAVPDFEPLPGARAYFGMLGSAGYRVEVPEQWNGDLLLWAKGFRGFGPDVAAEAPPPALRAAVIAAGYAWAASSYSEAGWVPGTGMSDTLALKRWFEKQFGRPVRTFIGGDSMGGNIVVLSLENYPDEYDGGLALCGVVAGGEWLDYLLAWGTVGEFLAGHRLPLEEGTEAVTRALEAQVLPVLGPVEAPTPGGRAFASVIRNLTGGPRPFFEEGFRASYVSNFGLITGDPGRVLPMTRAATTEGMRFQADPGLGFDGDAVDRGVRRLQADPALRDAALHPDLAPTTGRLRDPLLTLHETGDLTVPLSLEQSYRRKVDGFGNGELLVQRLIRGGGHCQFSENELVRAWTDLAAWVRTGTPPPGDAVLGDLSDAGLTFTDPLRPDDPKLR